MTSIRGLLIITAYFGVLFAVSFIISKKHSGNAAFFLGDKKSPWFAVALGMLGASISGVTFVSVPGMVRNFDMTYMQMVFGFIAGYLIIAFVLLPVYYKLNVTSIYSYLNVRLGKYSYKTGAAFFLLSRTVLAAVRLYLAVLILQTYVFDAWNIPFLVTAAGFLGMIWLYTYKSGIRTLVWTDILQTLVLIAALIIILYQLSKGLNLDFPGLIDSVKESSHSRIFVFDDWFSRQNFFKQFLSGCFITIAMTGIDQEMMQKNLSCKSLKDAQKNICTLSLFFIPVNLVFLCVGVLLLHYASANSIDLPALNDNILPMLVTDGYFGSISVVFFIIGIIAVTFAGADSALTGLTTSVCVDFLNIDKYKEKEAEKIRHKVHIGISFAFILIMVLFHAINNTSVIDAIYMIASYTYGPLLGLFAFGILTKRKTWDKITPVVCLSAPIICFVVNELLKEKMNYRMGYELLLLNALLVFVALWSFSFRKK
ncbi:MAG: sodium:solute symporter [Dysgonamonadaceae bacterium]|jgi:Na+/proline symporter|nr:sodium:solute symporter [Dysgonamonadaceae bacterium]